MVRICFAGVGRFILKYERLRLPSSIFPGLLTLRLLGKLGGKNRSFLREAIDFCAGANTENKSYPFLSLSCSWLDLRVPIEGAIESDREGQSLTKQFALALPLKECLEVLKQFAAIEEAREASSEQSKRIVVDSPRGECASNVEKPPPWRESDIWAMNIEEVDFGLYCHEISERTKRDQATASFKVMCTALSSLVDVADNTSCSFRLKVQDYPETKPTDDASDWPDDDKVFRHKACNSQQAEVQNEEFRCMSLGIMYSCIVDATSAEAMPYLKGLSSHVYFSVLSNQYWFEKIDAYGSRIEDSFKPKTDVESNLDEDERVGRLKPFGYFLPVKELRECVNPLVFNEALAEFLTGDLTRATHVGLEIVRHLLNMTETDLAGRTDANNAKTVTTRCTSSYPRGLLVFFENLISHLSTACIAHAWHRQEGLYEAVALVLDGLGKDFSLKFEEEMMILAFFVVKRVPKELATTSVRAFRFFVRVCYRIYGRPAFLDDELIWDALAIKADKDLPGDKPDSEAVPKAREVLCPCLAVLQLAVLELASPKQISR